MSRFNSWELLVQVSADSLTGEAGQEAKRTAVTLLKRGLVHIIASDSHSPFFRPTCLSFGVKAAEAVIGADHVRPMVVDIPPRGIGWKRLSGTSASIGRQTLVEDRIRESGPLIRRQDRNRRRRFEAL